MLDIEQNDALIGYLREKHYVDADEPLVIRHLPGGVSNRTVHVERANGEAWVLKQALEKLRVPVDWFSDPQRVHCEAAALRWLAKLAPEGTIPAFVFEDFEYHLLAMQAVPQPYMNWKQMLLSGDIQREHIEQFARLIGTIHRTATACLEELSAGLQFCTFFESLRLEPYYRYTAQQLPSVGRFMNDLIDETAEHAVTFVHGDYSPKNVLVRRNKLILLDHEVAHIGDAAFDLGFSLTHLLSKAHHLPMERRVFSALAQHYWHTYAELVRNLPWYSGLEARVVRHTLACLLARVAGRSPLEYLSQQERQNQRDVALQLTRDLPKTVPQLVQAFVTRLEDADYHKVKRS